jgi:hypothetical protein
VQRRQRTYWPFNTDSPVWRCPKIRPILMAQREKLFQVSFIHIPIPHQNTSIKKHSPRLFNINEALVKILPHQSAIYP